MREIGIALIIGAGAFFLGGQVLGKTEIQTVPGPPRDTTIVSVADTLVRADTIFRDNYVFSTDTVNLVDTLFLADTVRIACGAELEERHYVRDVRVGEELGDVTWIRGTRFSADSMGMRFQSFTQQVWTAGYLSDLSAGAEGVRVNFREFPDPKSCGVLDLAPWMGGSLGVGFVLGEIF